MNTAGAIEAGSSYVRFFGEWSELSDTMTAVEKRLHAWAARFQTSAAPATAAVSASLRVATADAAMFGQTATVAANQATAGMNQTATAGNTVAVTFARISQRALNAGAASAGFIARATSLRTIAGFLMNIDGTLGRIGRTATIVGLALKTIAFVLRLVGINSAGLSVTATNLLRIGRYSTIASFALWGVLGPARMIGPTLSAGATLAAGAWARLIGFIRSAPGAIASASTAAMRFGRTSAAARMGVAPPPMSGKIAQTASLGMVGAMSAGSGGGAASGMMMGFLMGGLTGAAVVGAAVWVANKFKKAWKDSMKDGGDSSGGFLEQAVYKARQYGKWISDTFDKVKEKIFGMFKSTRTEGESVFTRLERAIYPIVYAVENVWIPAVLGGIEKIRSLFARNTNEMGRTWTDWIIFAVARMADFVGNVDIYFLMGVEYAKLFAQNSVIAVQDFVQNSDRLGKWFLDNFKGVFEELSVAAAKTFIRIAKEFAKLGKQLFKAAKSGFTATINYDWKVDRSERKGPPELLWNKFLNSTPELEELKKKLEERQKAAGLNFKAFDPLSGKTTQTSVSALNTFAAARLGGNDGGFAARTARASEETASNTRKMADKPGFAWT